MSFTSIQINTLPQFGTIKDFYILHTDGEVCFVTGKNGKKMNPALQSTKYFQLHCRTKDDKIVTILQHRLYAIALIPNPENLRCIDHKNNQRDDNRISNLQWISHLGNSQKMVEEGRAPKGQRGKITMADLINIFVLSRKGLSQFEIAKRHEIDYTMVGKILREKTRVSDIAWLRSEGHI
jgi:hypothetical protein